MDNRFFLHDGEFKILPHPHYSSYSSFPLHPTIEQVVLLPLFSLESLRSLFSPFPIHSFPPAPSPPPLRPRPLLSSLPHPHPHHLRSSPHFLGRSSLQAFHSLSLRSHLPRLHAARAPASLSSAGPRRAHHAGRRRAHPAASAPLFGTHRGGRGGGIAENERGSAVSEGFDGGSVGLRADCEEQSVRSGPPIADRSVFVEAAGSSRQCRGERQ